MTSEPTQNDDGAIPSIPSEQAAESAPLEGAPSKPAANKRTATARSTTGARSTSSSSASRSSTPSSNRNRSAAASSDAPDSIAEPSAPARSTAAKRPSTAKKSTSSGAKRTPDPVRSAAAKAAAARRKAAKEAAAHEAAEAAALEAAATAPEGASEIDDAPPSSAAAPGGTPALPPLPPLSAEEAAAAFARAGRTDDDVVEVKQDEPVPVQVAQDEPVLVEDEPQLAETGPQPEVEPAREAVSGESVRHETGPAGSATSVATPDLATPDESTPAEATTVEAEPSEVGEVHAAPASSRPVGFLDRLRRALSGRDDSTKTRSEADLGSSEPGLRPSETTEGADVLAASLDTVVVPETASETHDENAAPDDGRSTDTRDATREPTDDAFATLARPAGADEPLGSGVVLAVRGLTKSFGDTRAVDAIDLDVRAGSFYGIVGPNGAGKTTTLSMITGLLRPDAGSVMVNGIDVWSDPAAAKRTIGVLPDRLRVFDRLTGAQLLYYAGTLRGLSGDVVRGRVEDLARVFGLQDAMGRLVSDYSAGMVKKVSLAAAMIHSPRVLILDEPFESVDPVSAAKVVEILRVYVDNGGTVVLSSHSMDFIQRVCDHVAIIVEGQVLAAGPVEDVRGPVSLEERFLELAGGRKAAEGMEWLHSFSG